MPLLLFTSGNHIWLWFLIFYLYYTQIFEKSQIVLEKRHGNIEKENLSDILIKMISSLKVNGIIYTSFKTGTGYEIKEGKYYNYLTKDEMIQTLNKTSKNVKIVDYFETLPSTRRMAENIIWGNFIIKKFE